WKTRLRRVDTTVLTSGFSDPTANVHPLCAERRITHPLGIGSKIVNRFFRHTATLSRVGSNGRQGSDGGDQFFNVAVYKQVAGVFGPNSCSFGLGSKNCASEPFKHAPGRGRDPQSVPPRESARQPASISKELHLLRSRVSLACSSPD